MQLRGLIVNLHVASGFTRGDKTLPDCFASASVVSNCVRNLILPALSSPASGPADSDIQQFKSHTSPSTAGLLPNQTPGAVSACNASSQAQCQHTAGNTPDPSQEAPQHQQQVKKSDKPSRQEDLPSNATGGADDSERNRWLRAAVAAAELMNLITTMIGVHDPTDGGCIHCYGWPRQLLM
jgi:hypothetical protein